MPSLNEGSLGSLVGKGDGRSSLQLVSSGVGKTAGNHALLDSSRYIRGEIFLVPTRQDKQA